MLLSRPKTASFQQPDIFMDRATSPTPDSAPPEITTLGDIAVHLTSKMKASETQIHRKYAIAMLVNFNSGGPTYEELLNQPVKCPDCLKEYRQCALKVSR